MVYVPPGEFWMGTNRQDAFKSEKPRRLVRLTRGFWIYKHEVTNAQYRKFVKDTGLHRPGNGLFIPWSIDRRNHPEQPVTGVSWYDADAYCEWAACRLPTEAE